MKLILKPAVIFITLLFGLVSCNSDEAQLTQTEQGSPRIGVQNPDKSYRYISDIREMDVQEALHLELEKDQIPGSEAHLHTQCQSNRFVGKKEREIRVQGLSHIPLVDVLPAEIFSPDQPSELRVHCDLKMDLYKDGQLIAQLILQQVALKGFDTFTNWRPAFFPESVDEPYFYSQQLNSQNIELPFPDNQFTMICEQKSQQISARSHEVRMDHFAQDHLIAKHKLTPCRLVTAQRQGYQQKVSPLFWVQNEKPEVTHHIDFLDEASQRNDLTQTPLIQVHLNNPTQSPVQISFGKKDLTMQFASIFLNSHNRNRSEFKKIPNQGMYLSLDSRDRGTIFLDNSEETQIEIPPQTTVSLQLYGRKILQCSASAGRRPVGENGICAGQLKYGGFMYELADAIPLKVNQLNHRKRFDWQDISIRVGQSRPEAEPLAHKVIFKSSPCLQTNQAWTHTFRFYAFNTHAVCGFQ